MSSHGEMERLERAMAVWLAYRAAPGDEPLDAFLARHGELRDLLEPLAEEGAEPIAEGDRMLGEYRLEREIGRGGMGVVYAAWQGVLDRYVALKVLPDHLTRSPKSVARFKREAATAGRLQHPGIVEIFSVSSVGDVHFFAMELIDGLPLNRVLAALARHDCDALTGSSLAEALAAPPQAWAVPHEVLHDGEPAAASGLGLISSSSPSYFTNA